MEINSICKGYRDYNEDAVGVIKDRLFIVIDGATSLGPSIKEPTDGVFLSSRLKEEILSIYRNGKLTPKNFVNKMNQLSKKLYKEFVKGIKEPLERYRFPQASMTVCYIDVCDVHIFSIGDTSTYLRFNQGKNRYISDQSIPILDKKTVKHYNDLGIYEFEKMIDTLRTNRELLNRGGKRSVFSLYEKPHLKFKHELYDIRDLKELYLCSDGYYRAFDKFKLYPSRDALFSVKNDLQDVYKKVIEASSIDKECKKYPRVTIKDDVSCVRVVF